jgi:hypothetical protein
MTRRGSVTPRVIRTTSNNYWSIYAGLGKDGFKRPVNGQPDKGVWNWDEPVQGDSLQGWWPQRMAATESSPTTTTANRPHTCLDFGNQANYVINESRGANWQNRANGHEPAGARSAWTVCGTVTAAAPRRRPDCRLRRGRRCRAPVRMDGRCARTATDGGRSAHGQSVQRGRLSSSIR